jgi:hypothetical protein
LDLKNSYVEKNFYTKYTFNKFGEVVNISSVDPDKARRRQNELLIKTRPDLFHKTRLFGLDVKTCQNVSPGAFSADAAQYEYDIQAAMEIDIVSAVTDMPYQTFVFIAVEKQGSHEAVIYNLFDEDIQNARIGYQRRLNGIREAMNSKKYAGWEYYADNEQGVLLLKMPTWLNQQRIQGKF